MSQVQDLCGICGKVDNAAINVLTRSNHTNCSRLGRYTIVCSTCTHQVRRLLSVTEHTAAFIVCHVEYGDVDSGKLAVGKGEQAPGLRS